MFRFAQRVSFVVVGLVLTLAVTNCGKKAAETVPPPASSSVVTVTGLEMGRAVGGDKRITDKTEQFKPNDVIYASVLTSGSSANSTLKARWTFEDGQVVDEFEQAIAPTSDAATEFHISKPDGWPPGKYRVELFLDGSPTQAKDFTVK